MKTQLRRLGGLLSLVFLSASTLSACAFDGGGDLLTSISEGKVILGTKYDQPGLGLRQIDGSMSGLDVDVATYVVNAIAEDKGYDKPEIEWREAPSSQRETLIRNGEVAMIAATYSINEGRLNTVNFGGPYLLTHQALLVREDSDIHSLEDLGKRGILCSVTGSTPAQKVKDKMPNIQLQEYDTYSSCAEALRQGNIDAMTTDATILNGYAQQDPGQFRLVEMEVDGKPFTNEYYGIGLLKDDTEATEAINRAIERMYADGSFDKFVQNNLGSSEGVEATEPGDLSFVSA